MADPGLTLLYVGALLASAGIALGVGVWSFRTSNAVGSRLFLALMVVDTVWAVVAAAGLVTTDPTLTWALHYAGAVVGLSTAALWYLFATVYTGRSPVGRRHVAVLTPLAVGVVLAATNPLHGLVWASTTYQGTPLSFVTTSPGPLLPLVNGAGFLAIVAGLHYLGELFVKSRHRASASVAVLVVGMVLGASVNLLSTVELVPVPAYDHTPFGIAVSAVSSGYAVFGMGMFDLRPVARDALVDEVDDALIALDPDCRVVDYNPAAAVLFEDTADPIGQPLSALCPSVTEAFTLPQAGETVTADTVTVSGGDHYSGRITAVTERGSVAGYAVVLRDVTERETYRRELERRNEQLDAFADTVAHDIRSPLQVADGNAARLDADGEQVAAIRSALERIDDIVTDLRTLADQRTTVTDPATVAFETTVAEAAATVGNEGATVEVTTAGTIEAERSRLLSVLENLLRNAVEHGERATVGDSGDPEEGGVRIRVGLTDDGFYVADDGPGIPPAEREQVFEYGYTDSEAGTGLGLAIVDAMAAAHGWSVAVTESWDGGARFEITGATTDPAAD